MSFQDSVYHPHSHITKTLRSWHFYLQSHFLWPHNYFVSFDRNISTVIFLVNMNLSLHLTWSCFLQHSQLPSHFTPTFLWVGTLWFIWEKLCLLPFWYRILWLCDINEPTHDNPLHACTKNTPLLSNKFKLPIRDAPWHKLTPRPCLGVAWKSTG